MPAPQHLPDNETLIKWRYIDGLSDEQIAKAAGVSIQAVNKRWKEPRKPHTNAAKAILDAAWPTTKDFKRSEYTHFGRAKELMYFMRWRLGDKTLSDTQLRLARRFHAYCVTHNAVLSFDLEAGPNPWVYVPREERDGRLVLRWPDNREKPKGQYLKAITLPPEGEVEVEEGRYRW
jgi:transcriptional regulator with XRE-family HTH domain